MPKYTAYVTVKMYRSFEFEADDIDLAYDHIEHLADHRGPSYILNEFDVSGPEDIFIDDIVEAR